VNKGMRTQTIGTGCTKCGGRVEVRVEVDRELLALSADPDAFFDAQRDAALKGATCSRCAEVKP
jgi:hypothetical protein